MAVAVAVAVADTLLAWAGAVAAVELGVRRLPAASATQAAVKGVMGRLPRAAAAAAAA